MSISLIKKQDNSKENQKEFQKLLLEKHNIQVSISEFSLEYINQNKNELKKSGHKFFIHYEVNTNGILFLKATLKKLLKLKNVIFKDFSRQEVIEYIETSTQDILKDLNNY